MTAGAATETHTRAACTDGECPEHPMCPVCDETFKIDCPVCDNDDPTDCAHCKGEGTLPCSAC